ncbi:DUF1493 family protein [Chryseobacterium fistulae]|uniref:DUF1493 family protein n=1 Tax=Chryseobacterium fistulae TaxID=2675058 RepID=A0A6N4XT74_9FLAO|nr:DUF1493 family protein [Chryseobacterium fistulae]CAA7386972.1 hypothetical protein CHRY9393_01273 [Chryseobacterium fistulae]
MKLPSIGVQISKKNILTSEYIEDNVINFFQRSLDEKMINKNTIINNDDYSSEDAFFMLEVFFEIFDIEKGYLDMDKYFRPTYPYGIGIYPLIKGILSKFNWAKKPIIEPKPPITIAHMIEVAKRNEWFDPE